MGNWTSDKLSCKGSQRGQTETVESDTGYHDRIGNGDVSV